MEITTNSEYSAEKNSIKENFLLDMIKEVCSEQILSTKIKSKITKIIQECNLEKYSSLHKMSTADENTSTLLGVLKHISTELTFEEQIELNEVFLQKIQNKLPVLVTQLEQLKLSRHTSNESKKEQIKALKESIDTKLNKLNDQENEKVELMMEWLNHRLLEVSKFNDDSSELLTLKTRVLELKSKILHLQILQNIFTETNQSIKAYTEVHKDIKESITETEERIKHFRSIIESDFA